MTLKYVISTETDPYRNLAMETDLMRYVTKDASILFLWQNENTIVIGRNQDALKECKKDEFLASGGRIARRMSGGGAVFHDTGNLCFSILSNNVNVNEMTYQKLISRTLEEYGLESEFNGRNDLTYQGRKFSGNAVYDKGDILCQHGTALVDVDIKKMEYYLTPEQSKFDRNHVSSIASRVVNLSEVSSSITVDKLRESLIRANGAKKMEYTPERGGYEKMVGFYSSRKWIYGGIK